MWQGWPHALHLHLSLFTGHRSLTYRNAIIVAAARRLQQSTMVTSSPRSVCKRRRNRKRRSRRSRRPVRIPINPREGQEDTDSPFLKGRPRNTEHALPDHNHTLQHGDHEPTQAHPALHKRKLRETARDALPSASGRRPLRRPDCTPSIMRAPRRARARM